MVLKLFNKIFNLEERLVLKNMKIANNAKHLYRTKYSILPQDEIQKMFVSLTPLDINSKEHITQALALVCYGSKHSLGLTPHATQLAGVLSILQRHIIEMKTGEGKTLVAALSATIGSLIHSQFTIVTVNDYLAERDCQTMSPLFTFFGLSHGFAGNDTTFANRQVAYSNKILYATNSTLAFDYLRNNIADSANEQFDISFDFCIIDEVDSILIDEARNPLIISGPAEHNEPFFIQSMQIAKTIPSEGFELDRESQNVSLTAIGISHIEKALGVSNLYVMENISFSHQIQQSLKTLFLMENNVDYIIKGDKAFIIDENTGRIQEGRRFSDGLHQAIEAKEGISIKEETVNLAEITYQHFFKLYKNFSGMSGTTATERNEFFDIYDKRVLIIPTNLPLTRNDKEDLIFVSNAQKLIYVGTKVQELNKQKIPVLIGTISVEQSELIANHLTSIGVQFNMLNAKNHSSEAEVILNAGQECSVTIATNMAGRGVDIKLSDETKKIGGLYIIGFERYQNRRIDNQLKGRSGRQGDPGTTQFLLSLDDNLLFSSKEGFLIEKLRVEMQTEKEGVSLSMISKLIEKQQNRREAMNFEHRKNLLKFDTLLSQQRLSIFHTRNEILHNASDIEFFRKKLELYLNEIFQEHTSPSPTIEQMIQVQEQFYLEPNKNILASEFFALTKQAISLKISEILSSQFAIIEVIPSFLNTIDILWRKHLSRLELLRHGVHLVAYNQKDPVIEFNIKAERYFSAMVKNAKIQIVQSVIRINTSPHSHVEEQDNSFLELNNRLEDNKKIIEKLIQNIQYSDDLIQVSRMIINETVEAILNGGEFSHASAHEIMRFLNLTPEDVETSDKEKFFLSSTTQFFNIINNKTNIISETYQNTILRQILMLNVPKHIETYNSALQDAMFDMLIPQDVKMKLSQELIDTLVFNIKFDFIINLANIDNILVKQANPEQVPNHV